MANANALQLISTTATRNQTTLISPSQSRIRQNIAACAAAWKTLTYDQKNAWLAFDKQRAALATPKRHNAFNAFVSINATRLASGMGLNTTPPANADLPPGLPSDLLVDATYPGVPGSAPRTVGALSLWLRSTAFSHVVQIYASAPTLAGMDTRTTSGRFSLITVAGLIPDGGLDITIPYLAKFGDAPIGSQVAFQLVPISATGLRGVPLLLTGVVTIDAARPAPAPKLTTTK